MQPIDANDVAVTLANIAVGRLRMQQPNHGPGTNPHLRTRPTSLERESPRARDHRRPERRLRCL